MTHLVLPVKLANQIDPILVHLRRMTEAECVLLADISGQLISIVGQMDEGDPALVAALAASDAAALDELSRQIGEDNPSGGFLHEGAHKSVYIYSVAANLLLITIFRSETPVGLVRLFVGRAVEKLLPLTDQFEELIKRPTENPGVDFSAALSDELERAFNL